MSKRSNIQEDEQTYGRKRYSNPQGAGEKTHMNGQRKTGNKPTTKARAKHSLHN